MRWFPLAIIPLHVCLLLGQTALGPATVPPYSTKPFDLSAERLPIGYKGHDVVMLYTELSRRYGQQKSEFETTQQYEARLRTQLAKPVVGELVPDSVYGFLISGCDNLYDADNAELVLSCGVGYPATDDPVLSNTRTLNFKSTTLKRAPYVANNAFGVKLIVSSEEVTSYDLAFDDKRAFGIDNDVVRLPVSMNPQDARRQKTLAKVLLVGKLIPPFVRSAERLHSPTFDSPREQLRKEHYLAVEPRGLWIFDPSSGKVFLRRMIDLYGKFLLGDSFPVRGMAIPTPRGSKVSKVSDEVFNVETTSSAADVSEFYLKALPKYMWDKGNAEMCWSRQNPISNKSETLCLTSTTITDLSITTIRVTQNSTDERATIQAIPKATSRFERAYQLSGRLRDLARAEMSISSREQYETILKELRAEVDRLKQVSTTGSGRTQEITATEDRQALVFFQEAADLYADAMTLKNEQQSDGPWAGFIPVDAGITNPVIKRIVDRYEIPTVIRQAAPPFSAKAAVVLPDSILKLWALAAEALTDAVKAAKLLP